MISLTTVCNTLTSVQNLRQKVKEAIVKSKNFTYYLTNEECAAVLE